MNDLSQYKSQLKWTSWFVILIGLSRAVSSITEVLTSPDTITAALSAQGLTNIEGIYSTVTTLTIVFSVVGFLFMLFIGLKGVIMANGGKRSGAAIVLAWIFAVLVAISVIMGIMNIARGIITISDVNFWMSIALLIAYASYIYYAKKLFDAKRI